MYFSAILDGIQNVFYSFLLCWHISATSVKSNPHELFNVVTLLDFLFLLEKDCEARRWLANKL